MNNRPLMDTSAKPGNTKVAKTQKLGDAVRVASLSLMPDALLCPGSKAAGCFDDCLKAAGRGAFQNVKATGNGAPIYGTPTGRNSSNGCAANWTDSKSFALGRM